MKIEKLNDNQVKFTLWTEDLEENDVEISDITSNNEKGEELLRMMIERARDELGFETDEQSILIEAMTIDNECVVLILTKVDRNADDDTKNDLLGQLRQQVHEIARTHRENAEKERRTLPGAKQPGDNMYKAAEPQPEKTAATATQEPAYLIFRFDNLDNLIYVSKLCGIYYDSDNTLYKNPKDQAYFLVATRNRNTAEEFDNLNNALQEYGMKYMQTSSTRFFIDEHYTRIIENTAIQTLAEL